MGAAFSLFFFLEAHSTPVPGNNTSHSQSTTAIANPASQNCIKRGGTLTIQKRGDGGEYGICIFEDNRQCEEWALLRGTCPVGGRKVTGYATEAARYCAITGGRYRISGGDGQPEQEPGSCSRADKTCEVWAYFNGRCRLDD
ncbi:DUF333 domain-containing protein [Candidatus Methylospira mobilis]|uniref:DUF333 domain-containing protein n=2 Tax=Candidatus Methylospira mobilis TaxID=1808979 RepID=A0A5Q0BRS9_9GAMM|nr:DUF333 domain-containing protein [Candidatus Methylospira mobilis]